MRRERDGAEDVVGEPAGLAGLDRAGVLDGAGQQRGGRPGVLEAPVPRAAGQAGGDEAFALGLVEAVGEVQPAG